MNPFDLLKNAQQLQDQFGKVQSELKDLSATGMSGGGIVKITVNGQLEFVSVEIDPIAIDPRDVPMLQDLIIAAQRDALVKIREVISARLGPMMGGMNIPGLMQ